MRSFIDTIRSLYEDAAPIDRRITSQLSFQAAAEKRAEQDGITVLQARNVLKAEEYMKRNASKIRAKRWAEKAALDEDTDAVAAFRQSLLDSYADVFRSYPSEVRQRICTMLTKLSETEENRAIIREAFDLVEAEEG